MAGMNVPMSQSPGRRIGGAAVNAPRLVMSWEDWLTFVAAIVTFVSIAVSIQNAHWVRNMPALVPTALAGLLIGMIGARMKMKAVAIHPIALFLGLCVVVLVVQTYADGATIADRLADFRVRMREWMDVVRAGDISNDNLPFVTLVHGICFLAAYTAAWSIYRWRNPWLAIIPGGMVLLANIAFLKGQPSGAFIVFLFGAVVLIARLHLQRSQARWKRQRTDYPEFISMSATQLTLMVATGLIVGAWLLPVGNQLNAADSIFHTLTQPVRGQTNTFVRLFHNVNSAKGANLHSFGDFLVIQGNVKLGTKNEFEIDSPQPGLVRAQSYEEYTGSGWIASSRNESRVDAKDLAVTAEDTRYQARNVSILKVKLLDSESTVLTPGIPLGTNLATTAQSTKNSQGDIERLQSRTSLGTNDTYNSIGSESMATADQLKAAGTTYPSWVRDKYLQLPNSLPQRVRDEAKRVAASGKTPYEQAQAIESYLRDFPYDLSVESAPPGQDTVDYFLFTLKRGYFDYQATAMAVMLRSIGIPARVAVGYVLDSTKAIDQRYTVSKNDAYSWVEVFFPNYGWVNFNPTQDRPAGGAGGGINGGSTGDPSSLQGPDLSSVLDNIFGADDPGGPTSPIQAALNQDASVTSDPPWILIWSLTGAFAVVALALAGGRFSWNYGMAGLEGRAKMWAKVQRVAGWAGLGARTGETPREWSRRLGGAIDREADASQLADAYEETRYGPKDLQRVDENVAQKAYHSLRNTLFGAVLRRGRQPREKTVTPRK
jgi:transglutaminase-like putative cysteine protease